MNANMKNLVKMISASLFGVMLFSCSAKTEKNKEAVVPVDVYSPTAVADNGFYLSGQVVAGQSATISSRMMGYVNKVYVKIGDRVSAGQMLISISHNDISAKQGQVGAMITAARAAMNNAKKDYERYKTLHSQNSVSDKELENVALQYTSAKSNLKVAQESMKEVNANLAYSNIKAPFSGVVTQRLIDNGSMANPGSPLLVIDHAGNLEIQASVPESYVKYVNVGDNATVKIKSLGTGFTGKVIEISPSAVATGGQYMMKLSVNSQASKQLQAGMYASILFNKSVDSSDSGTISVDSSSIVHKDELTGVYTVDSNNQAVLRWIRLGRKTGERFEVLSGLTTSDRIISKAYGKLYNGAKVTISQK